MLKLAIFSYLKGFEAWWKVCLDHMIDGQYLSVRNLEQRERFHKNRSWVPPVEHLWLDIWLSKIENETIGSEFTLFR